MSWAINSDLSGITKTPDGFGQFSTPEKALTRLISIIDIQIDDLKRARRSAQGKLRRKQRKIS